MLLFIASSSSVRLQAQFIHAFCLESPKAMPSMFQSVISCHIGTVNAEKIFECFFTKSTLSRLPRICLVANKEKMASFQVHLLPSSEMVSSFLSVTFSSHCNLKYEDLEVEFDPRFYRARKIETFFTTQTRDVNPITMEV